MSPKIIISRAHRDALYAELLRSLGEFEELLSLGIGDSPEDVEGAERIARRMADVLRLIQDGGIGWGYPADTRETRELTLSPDELRRIIEVHRADLAALQESERAQREESESSWTQTRAAREACTSVLDQLGGRP